MAERYAAFLSYSHLDAKVAAWLQRALEGYRVPPYVIGRPGAFGAVPARIGAVFRDREDLPASSDLAASVKAALAASDALIVICSPGAAKSRWVNAEIALFKAQGNPERVFALIVDGEPFASDMPGHEGEECMPLALRRYVGPDGAVSDQLAEPMAADLRHEHDGRRLARSKIVAGLLGIPLDMLIRREHARRQRGWAALASALMIGMVGMGALAWEARSARDAARARRADAEQLVAFMLGDLRKRLDAVGRLDVLDAVGAQTMRYYARQDPKSMEPDELAQRARALRLVGELSSTRGDFGTAGSTFEQAAATTGELLARDPQNGQRIFDHAQSVFWVGSVALQRGDRATEARAFRAYAALADRLVAIDPRRDEWQAEVASSRTNLGTMEMEDRQVDAAVGDFGRAVSVEDALTTRHRDAEWRGNYANSIAWLADAERFRGHLKAAADARLRELAIYQALVRSDPSDYPSLQSLAWTHHALGDLAMDRGDVTEAIDAYRQAGQMMERLLRIEPGNVDTLQRTAVIDCDLAQAYMAAKQTGNADERLGRARQLASQLVARDRSVPRWRELRAHTDLIAAEFALARGDRHAADWLSASAAEELELLAKKSRLTAEATFWRARERALRARLGIDGSNGWRAVVAAFNVPPARLRLDETCLLRDAYTNLGREAEAAALTRRLGGLGYLRPNCRTTRLAKG